MLTLGARGVVGTVHAGRMKALGGSCYGAEKRRRTRGSEIPRGMTGKQVQGAERRPGSARVSKAGKRSAGDARGEARQRVVSQSLGKSSTHPVRAQAVEELMQVQLATVNRLREEGTSNS